MFADEWCLVKVSHAPAGTGVVKPFGGADPSDTHWLYDEIYYNSPTGTYFAASELSWINHDYASDASIFTGCGYSEGVGEQEGAGIRLSGGEYVNLGHTLYIGGDPGLDSYGGDYSDYKHLTSAGVDPDQYGTGYFWQDNTQYVTGALGVCLDLPGETDTMDYDSYKIWLAMEFVTLQGDCHNAQVISQYEHTWDTTSVTGFDISGTSFGIQWQNVGSSFPDGDTGQVARVC